ncbi:BRO-N domain-containing protein [Streptacidiphilus jiangxiensis]|uniref:BRO family, N-terminal domain n=1 Tax=Streptacidiphilus jiangxiensis TaxID=235985 RepID=A0A1H7JGK4_STRJI|nr:Bro-N domain-containing protein [Streptacidiphilus jiangxiensis]SEK73778.1 BRO family, N-terminal domain [Streptacidiphilus jiangxiensis]
MHTHLMHTEFPTTGQPIRVVLIDGEPWFVVRDVCRILGIRNTRTAASVLATDQKITVDVRESSVGSTDGTHETPGEKGYATGNPRMTATNESGLYTLIMRSRKPTARPFQDWFTRELLPSIRRADTDLGAVRERMAETFAEALDLEPPAVGDRRIDVDDQPFEVRNDGHVYCPHGRMRLISPVREDELEPPFGPYFLCTEVERVGIRRHIAHHPPCRRLLHTSMVRHLLRQTAPLPEADITVNLGAAQLHGKPAHIAEVLHRLGTAGPAY